MNPYYFPDETVAYGFLTRGCIRNCYFCKVPKYEGKLRICDTIENIVGDKKQVVLMDNNLFANPEYPHALEYLIDNRILSDLNQGLDFRLTDNLSLSAKPSQAY